MGTSTCRMYCSYFYCCDYQIWAYAGISKEVTSQKVEVQEKLDKSEARREKVESSLEQTKSSLKDAQAKLADSKTKLKKAESASKDKRSW
ncbi:ATP synthase F0 subunit B [Bacillus megaterium]|nr:ATP synthase F0 subunit B [Priestia megaterium]